MHELLIEREPQVSLDLPADVGEAFRASYASIRRRGQLIWAEHCTECAMPACFVSCSLYTPRPDLKCRRLANGIEPHHLRGRHSVSVRLMRVSFRQWGKLEARGYPGLLNRRSSKACEALDTALQGLVKSPGLPYGVVRRSLKPLDLARESVAKMLRTAVEPDGFIVEVYSDSPVERMLDVTFKPVGGRGLFQETVRLAGGYNFITIRPSRWRDLVDLSEPFLVQIAPRDESPASLTFGLLDFVTFEPVDASQAIGQTVPHVTSGAGSRHVSRAPDVKCVIWDLDNTVWAGTLVEDGLAGLNLNPQAAAAIVELDRRGILNSVISKNSMPDVEIALKRFGLWDYFLHPQISWAPKSAGVAAIARSLNISTDTFLVIDDQPFERAEILYAHPGVETADIDQIPSLLSHPRLQGSLSAEAGRRRLMYIEDMTRSAAMEESGTPDVADFLRQCDMRLDICELDGSNIARVFELTERTNQLNYSGGRLGRSALDDLMRDDCRLSLVLSAADRFGEYGVIGFAVVTLSQWEVEHFFMSCRVQRKKLDHEFFQRLMIAGRMRGIPELKIRFQPTLKNAPSCEVLEIDMRLSSRTENGVTFFCVDTSATLPDTGVVKVTDRSRILDGLKSPSAAPC